MINFNVRVDLGNLSQRIEDATEHAQFLFDSEILKDCNQYVPMDQQVLERSSISASKLGEGLLVWSTPYARRLYFGTEYNFSTDKNPKAGPFWFEKAKSAHLRDWKRLLERAIADGL